MGKREGRKGEEGEKRTPIFTDVVIRGVHFQKTTAAIVHKQQQNEHSTSSVLLPLETHHPSFEFSKLNVGDIKCTAGRLVTKVLFGSLPNATQRSFWARIQKYIRVQRKCHWSDLLPPFRDRHFVEMLVITSKEDVFWARSVHPIKRKNKAGKTRPLEHLVMPIPASQLHTTPHPPPLQKLTTAFKVLYFISLLVIWLSLRPCVQLSRCHYKHSLGPPWTVARIGGAQSGGSEPAWRCHLGKEPKEEELSPALTSSHIQGIIYFFNFYFIKKTVNVRKSKI